MCKAAEQAKGMHSMGVMTDPKKMKKEVKEAVAQPKGPRYLDNILNRMKCSVDAVTAATLDVGLRDYLLSYLLSDVVKKGHTIPVPEDLKTEPLSAPAFQGDREAMRVAQYGVDSSVLEASRWA